MTYARLVNSPDQVAQNAARFRDVMEGAASPAKAELIATIPYFRSWIAVDVNGEVILAPSKWVGYANMEPDFYSSHHHDQLDGRETERVMSPWLKPVDKDHPLWDELYRFCARYEKKPNGACRISMLQTDADAEPRSSNHLPELLVAVFQTLPADQQQKVRKRLGKG